MYIIIQDFLSVKHRKNGEISFYILNENGKFAEYEIADISGEPLEIITREERIQKIRGLIYTLPDNLRDMIVMRDINGLSYNEIAKSLEIKASTVKKRIYRARQKLKKYLN